MCPTTVWLARTRVSNPDIWPSMLLRALWLLVQNSGGMECASDRQNSRTFDMSKDWRSVGKSRLRSPCTLNDPPAWLDSEKTYAMECATPYWSEVVWADPWEAL